MRLIGAIFVTASAFTTSTTVLANIEAAPSGIDPGRRGPELAAQLPDSELRERLLACEHSTGISKFSIAHRGAPLGYPEHTREGYIAAAAMGAGAIECDVTFTEDGALVCRHSPCDLHRTTNILATPLAERCSEPFEPATGKRPAHARCCTTDVTLDQFKSLCGRRDVVNAQADSVSTYLVDPGSVVNPSPSACGTLMTHAESIALIHALDRDFIPELKAPQVTMPYRGMSQQAYASRMLAEYTAAGIPPERVRPQSFVLADVRHWLEHHPEFGRRAVYLDPRGRDADFAPTLEDMQRLVEMGISTLAPPIPMLLTLDAQGRLQASEYARLARQAGLELITWTFESGRATDPENWLYRPVQAYMDHESRMLEVLHALYTQVGIVGIFSDWPGTVTFYANCMVR